MRFGKKKLKRVTLCTVGAYFITMDGIQFSHANNLERIFIKNDAFHNMVFQRLRETVKNK